MLDGVIVQALNIWYRVATPEGVLSCRPRGRLKRGGEAGRGLLVGDRVRCLRLPDGGGRIEEVLPRRNRLIRPPVANVDQVLVVFTLHDPPLNLELVDRILVRAAHEGLAAVLALNKADLWTDGDREEAARLAALYAEAGYPCFRVSAASGEGIAALRARLGGGRVTVVAGPSGAGKSSLLNALDPRLGLRTGPVGDKAGRGRHTTRHVALLPLGGTVPGAGGGGPDGAGPSPAAAPEGWVADAPGFSRVDLADLRPRDLAAAFPELAAREGGCRFQGCLHHREPGCAVTAAVAAGAIDARRHGRYLKFLEEVLAAARRR